MAVKVSSVSWPFPAVLMLMAQPEAIDVQVMRAEDSFDAASGCLNCLLKVFEVSRLIN